jgi:hypothetical protein
MAPNFPVEAASLFALSAARSIILLKASTAGSRALCAVLGLAGAAGEERPGAEVVAAESDPGPGPGGLLLFLLLDISPLIYSKEHNLQLKTCIHAINVSPLASSLHVVVFSIHLMADDRKSGARGIDRIRPPGEVQGRHLNRGLCLSNGPVTLETEMPLLVIDEDFFISRLP